MDSLTHIAIGACIGEAFFEKGFGKKAMLWGALAQSIPDIDFITNLWMKTPEALLAHRGFTHSILFAFLIIPIFALLAEKIHRPHNISFKNWLLFFGVAVFVHLFLDAFNNYGIGWFEPLSHQRFSFNVIYVADPFFSFFPILALAILLYKHRLDPMRTFWWKLGLYFPLIYLSYTVINKIKINEVVEQNLSIRKLPFNRYLTTPAPLQNWLWYVVIESDLGYQVGYYSLFDQSSKIQLHYFPKNHALAINLDNDESYQKLVRFSHHYYTLEMQNGQHIFNDLRFGQTFGWQNPSGNFVFHYILTKPQENAMIIQRGRFSNWNKSQMIYFFKRVFGRSNLRLK